MGEEVEGTWAVGHLLPDIQTLPLMASETPRSSVHEAKSTSSGLMTSHWFFIGDPDQFIQPPGVSMPQMSNRNTSRFYLLRIVRMT